MAHLTAKERKLYTETFLSMDTSGDGTLSVQELAAGCSQLGFKMTQADAQATFQAIDKDGNGKITLDEFLSVMLHLQNSKPKAKREAALRRSFQSMDVDGDGLLSENELLEGLREAGYKNVSKSQVRKIISDLDKDGNRKLSFEEFIKMFEV